MGLLVVICLVSGIWLFIKWLNAKRQSDSALRQEVIQKESDLARRAALLGKYGDTELVRRIVARLVWQGQTQEQLLDSLGQPADTDERVLKNKTRKTWKYHPVGKNRYNLRVILENGVVVGWDRK